MIDRFENEERERRARARAHLARVRSRQGEGRVVWRTREEREPEPRRTRPRIERREIVAVLAGSLLAGLLLGDGWLLSARDAFASEPLEIDRIAVRGAARLAPTTVARATGVEPGTRHANVDAAQVALTLADHAWIREARALRLPGGTLVVEVHEREPIATARAGAAARRFAVDASGTPFAPAGADSESLLRLDTATPVDPGEPDLRLVAALELAKRLLTLGLAVPSEVGVPDEADADGFTLRFPGLATRFVLGREDLDARAERLARLLAQRPAEVAAAERVDLRFEDQVVLEKGSARNGSARNAASRGRATPAGKRRSG